MVGSTSDLPFGDALTSETFDIHITDAMPKHETFDIPITLGSDGAQMHVQHNSSALSVNASTRANSATGVHAVHASSLDSSVNGLPIFGADTEPKSPPAKAPPTKAPPADATMGKTPPAHAAIANTTPAKVPPAKARPAKATAPKATIAKASPAKNAAANVGIGEASDDARADPNAARQQRIEAAQAEIDVLAKQKEAEKAGAANAALVKQIQSKRAVLAKMQAVNKHALAATKARHVASGEEITNLSLFGLLGDDDEPAAPTDPNAASRQRIAAKQAEMDGLGFRIRELTEQMGVAQAELNKEIGSAAEMHDQAEQAAKKRNELALANGAKQEGAPVSKDKAQAQDKAADDLGMPAFIGGG